MNTEQRDEIGVAVQGWVLERVELMTYKLNRFKHLNGIQWSSFQIPLRATFDSYFWKYFNGEYHMYQFPLLQGDYYYYYIIMFLENEFVYKYIYR